RDTSFLAGAQDHAVPVGEAVPACHVKRMIEHTRSGHDEREQLRTALTWLRKSARVMRPKSCQFLIRLANSPRTCQSNTVNELALLSACKSATAFACFAGSFGSK